MKESQRSIAILNTAMRYCKWLIVILIVLICCSGIRVVNNYEVAVVLRFGRLVGDTREEQVREPGLLLAFPYVIDEVIKVPVGKVHEVSISTHADIADPTYAEIENTGYVITGDESISKEKKKPGGLAGWKGYPTFTSTGARNTTQPIDQTGTEEKQVNNHSHRERISEEPGL